MAKYIQKTLEPNYIQNFQCIGTACEDTCCAGWQVNIDKNTYKKYQKVKDPALKDTLDKSIVRNKNNPSEHWYASIKMDNKGYCPLLTSDNLCSLQKNLGNKYLSQVCSVYPRSVNVVNKTIETSLSLSCPEAARIVLLNESIMEFDANEEATGNVHTPSQKVMNTSDDRSTQIFWNIRSASIRIMQRRQYTVEARLIILGLALNKINGLMKENNQSQIDVAIKMYDDMMTSNDFGQILNNIPSKTNIQLQLLNQLLAMRMQMQVTNNTYTQCLNEMLSGLGANNGSSHNDMAENYSNAYGNYYSPYIEKNQHILENYIVNYMFRTIFPFDVEHNVYDSYVMMVTNYAMFKMHLIGVASYHQKLNSDLVIKVAYSLARVIDHNPAFLKQMYNFLVSEKYNTAAFAAILIKN